MNFLNSINEIQVTFDDLWRVADEAALLHESDEIDFEALMVVIARLYKGEPRKAGAVLLRMQALARLIGEEGAPGWTLPKQPDGSIPTREWVLAAAAVQPLVESENDARFDKQAFLDKVLELSKEEGNA